VTRAALRRINERSWWFGLVIALIAAYNERALRLQAAEYERRLDVLNHAHSEAREVQATFLTAEKFEDFKEATDKALSLAAGAKAGLGRLGMLIVGGFAVLAAIVGLANLLTGTG